MAMTETLSGTINAGLRISLAREQSQISGKDTLAHNITRAISDGAGSNAATGYFGSVFTATTSGITVSLADSADPLGAAGDDVPSSDPEGLKLRAIMIENLDDTNFIDVGLGTNALTNWLTGTTPEIRIPALGFILSTMPAGLDAMNDGADDEIKITADTASCSVRISYIYG